MTDVLQNQVEGLLQEGDPFRIRALLDELQPYDLAQILTQLPIDLHKTYLSFLHPEEIADILEFLEINDQESLIDRLGTERASEILNLMATDDVADLLAQLKKGEAQALLTSMDRQEARKVEALMQHDPETAGGIMTNDIVWIKSYFTAEEAIEKVRSFAHIAEHIYYIYVVEEPRQLVGVISLRDLFLANPKTRISDIMYERVISVPADMDQERVAQIFEQYDFVALPVVDKNNTLLGIITVDDIIDVVIEEANEDFEQLSGAHEDTLDLETPAFTAAYRRLTWLILLLFLYIFTGSIVDRFESTLSQVVALAAFMPMIAGMTGNTGTQSLAVVIRGLASKEFDKATIYRLVRREAGVGLIIGLVCGLTITVVGGIWQGNPYIGLVVGFSLFNTLVVGTLTGTVVPIILDHLNMDPAIASGPMISTLNDIISLTIYFGTATTFLAYLT